MSAGNFTFYNAFKLNLAKAEVDLDTNTFKAVLLSSSYTPNVASQSILSDISGNIITDSDYVAQTLGSVTVTESGGTVTFDSADINFGSSVTITAKYLALYDDTSANDKLVVYVDLDTSGGSVSSTSSTFQVTINASGIFTLA